MLSYLLYFLTQRLGPPPNMLTVPGHAGNSSPCSTSTVSLPMMSVCVYLQHANNRHWCPVKTSDSTQTCRSSEVFSKRCSCRLQPSFTPMVQIMFCEKKHVHESKKQPRTSVRTRKCQASYTERFILFYLMFLFIYNNDVTDTTRTTAYIRSYTDFCACTDSHTGTSTVHIPQY